MTASWLSMFYQYQSWHLLNGFFLSKRAFRHWTIFTKPPRLTLLCFFSQKYSTMIPWTQTNNSLFFIKTHYKGYFFITIVWAMLMKNAMHLRCKTLNIITIEPLCTFTFIHANRSTNRHISHISWKYYRLISETLMHLFLHSVLVAFSNRLVWRHVSVNASHFTGYLVVSLEDDSGLKTQHFWPFVMAIHQSPMDFLQRGPIMKLYAPSLWRALGIVGLIWQPKTMI